MTGVDPAESESEPFIWFPDPVAEADWDRAMFGWRMTVPIVILDSDDEVICGTPEPFPPESPCSSPSCPDVSG